MRAPNSRRPLGTPGSSCLAVSSTVLLIYLLVPIAASALSVASVIPGRSFSAFGGSADGAIATSPNSEAHRVDRASSISSGRDEDERDDDSAWTRRVSRRRGTVIIDKKLTSQIETRLRKRDEEAASPKEVPGKSSSAKEYGSAKRVAVASRDEQEGIRRFDANVASDENVGKASGTKSEKSQGIAEVNPEIGKTVSKGIIVRDEPEVTEIGGDAYASHGVVEPSELGRRRKRGSSEAGSSGVSAESLKENPTMENHEPSSGRVKLDVSSHVSSGGSTVGSSESGRVPVLVPVGSSHAKSHHKLSKQFVPGTMGQDDDQGHSLNQAGNEKGESGTEDDVEKIPELVEAQKATGGEVGGNDKSEVVGPETRKIVVQPDGLGEVSTQSKASPDQVGNSLKSLPSGEEERAESTIGVGTRSRKETAKPVKNQDSLDYESSSLMNIVRTNVSLEGLKLQAIALQEDIKNKTLLQRLKDQAIQVLPGIPKFDEPELLEALKVISSLKKLSPEAPEDSHLSKIDTSLLSESQLRILRCAEALVVREQRQTFTENVFECIRGWNIFNCLRIFVWPLIADNIPESVTQYLPTLPIEVNVMDLLPGNREEKPKSTRDSSAAGSHQQRLVTPELVVSGILKDALSANPSNGEISTTFIDPHNEILSKLLTPGQLDILKMAERFLPESARQEYSNRMYSCVRRFEYFSCIKYFAWPMVKQHFPELPEFPDYQSWYPNVTLYPGYPVLPFPNTEGIGELPEIVEADATRTRRPRPEAVIVHILENTLRQAPNVPVVDYQVRLPEVTLSSVSADQMAIFYTAELLIPVAMRPEFMSKTMQCIRDYDYLTCTKYSTWPTVRQFFPTLPNFPDFSSWIPTFAVPQLPDFSQYIPDFGSYFPGFPALPGFPGSSPTPAPTPPPTPAPTPDATPAPTPAPQPIPDKPPSESQGGATKSSSLPNEDQRPAGAGNPIEQGVIQSLYNTGWTVVARNFPPQVPKFQGKFAGLNALTFAEYQIFGLALSALPDQRREDVLERFAECTQGGNEFMSCMESVLKPEFPMYDEYEKKREDARRNALIMASKAQKNLGEDYGSRGSRLDSMRPGVYQPIVHLPGYDGLTVVKKVDQQFAGRSPIVSQIIAEPEESPIPLAQIQPEAQTSENIGQEPAVDSVDQKVFAKTSDPSAPVISVTDTRFTPIFSDNPESVLLKILTTVQSSSKFSESSHALATSEYLDSLGGLLNADQRSIIRVSEGLLPDGVRLKYIEAMSGCVRSSNFIGCSRDVVWPTLLQYYPRLPSFPNFNIDDSSEALKSGSSESTKANVPGAGGASVISETDVKTGQHGDAVVTITDTRFVPLFSQHPESVILGILKNVQSSSPNLLIHEGAAKVVSRSSEFQVSFTDQQGNIMTISESLLPESIREVFTKRMTECVKENSFLACTRDIAWPTIAQFFPRLPNFPNIGALPEFAIEKPQQPTLLPPELHPDVGHDAPTETPIAENDPSVAHGAQSLLAGPSVALPAQNLLPVMSEDVELRIESMLRQAIASSSGLQTKPESSYLTAKDPLTVSFLTERQSNVIRMTESMLPSAMKPLFVTLMVDCSRENLFPICVRDVAWPMLRQFVPNVPNLPDLSNFGSYFPQIPQEIPQVPQFPDYPSQLPQVPQFPDYQTQLPQIPQFPDYQTQRPQIPNFPGFGLPAQGFGYPFQAGENTKGSLIAAGHQLVAQPGGVYIQGIRGVTPSVDSSGGGDDRGSSSDSSLVPGRAGLPTDLLSGTVGSSVRRRERRSLAAEPTDGRPGVSPDIDDQPNITESEFLRILINVTKQSKEEIRRPEVYYVDRLNSTTRDSLTDDQYAILKIVEDISHGTAKAGFISRVVQCITSLSFIRCMGIFVWPVITQNVPSLLGVPNLGSFNPFGRSHETNDTFADIFGMSRTEFEDELLARKDKAEGVLIDWYRGIVEERYDNDYGFMRVQGYGDGELGISFNGFGRQGRFSRLKDHKSLPSILTILSDIMEDMLTQKEPSPEKERKKENGRRANGKRLRSLGGRAIEDYNGLSSEQDDRTESVRSSNDDEIIAMFLDKLKSNLPSDNGGSETVDQEGENPYEAFGLLFGTRLSGRTTEKLDGKSRFKLFAEENSEEAADGNDEAVSRGVPSMESAAEMEKKMYQDLEGRKEAKKKIRSDLVIRLPKIDEELVSRKITGGLASLGRKMNKQMSQLLPGITFVASFLIQMALAHAKAAASMAGMMSNIAFGSAMLSMLRQSIFGPSTEPKIKYVYDNEAAGHGIVWPQHNHHG